MATILHGMLSPADGMAMSMVAIIILSLGMVALLVSIIRRSGQRAETEVEKLLDELRKEEEEEEAKRHPAPPTGPEKKLEPWEKKEDWWRE